MPNNLPNREYRTADVALQRVNIESLKGIIEGYPIVFNQRTCIAGMFYEEIAANALDNADLTDVPLFANHNDQMMPFARHRRGKRSTMDITVDEIGLFIKAQLDIENNSTARELCSAITREDIAGMSFCFGIEVDENDDEWFDIDVPGVLPFRRILRIRKVFEVSAVNNPAYPQTSISARSTLPLENAKRALDNARSAALENEKSARLALEKQKIRIMEEFSL